MRDVLAEVTSWRERGDKIAVATVVDVPHFVRQTGNALAAQDRDGEVYIFKIVKRK